MPIYQYKCEKCGSKIEIRQGFTGAVPLCCGKAMKRIPSLPLPARILNRDGHRQYPDLYKRNYSRRYLKQLEEERKS